jgi:biopolymer transport protein ExbD
MIDVIFLLLIFFMTTTTLAPPESELTSGLRAESQSGSASNLAPQIVEVGVFGGSPGFRLGERVVRSRDGLTGLLAELPKDAGVFVRVQNDVDVAMPAAALQACNDAGFVRVTYVPVP